MAGFIHLEESIFKKCLDINKKELLEKIKIWYVWIYF